VLTTASSETVNFQLFSLADSNFAKKLTDMNSLIALELNYFTIFGMFDDRAIAGEFLLECTQKTFLIELVADALDNDK
jgi:hypothetical protein